MVGVGVEEELSSGYDASAFKVLYLYLYRFYHMKTFLFLLYIRLNLIMLTTYLRYLLSWDCRMHLFH